MIKLLKTVLNEIKFRECKMLGLDFSSVNSFGLSLEFVDCNLNHGSFYNISLKNTLFKNCQLVEADFAEADLESALFINCDLSGAMFDATILEKADFTTSFNFSIDPEKNHVKEAKFSIQNLSGLLGKYGIVIEG